MTGFETMFGVADTSWLPPKMPAITPTIRLARLEEVRELIHLMKLSVRNLHRKDYSAEQIEAALTHLYGIDSQLIKDGTYFVAEIDGQIVGCGGWSKRRTLYGGDQFETRIDDELDPAVDAARIRAFFVDPDHARKGIGRSILATCEAAAVQAGFRRAEMGATLPGVPMYAALGYAGDEVIDIDMGDGYNLRCIRMEKSLGPG